MILPLRSEADAEDAAPKVRRHLDAGLVLAYPTETVYGLGTATTDPALERLARLKGRPEGKPFLVLISGLEMLSGLGLSLTPAARVLGREFWPGPLTLVLRGGEGHLPERLRGREGGIAVRWTSHRPLARLIERIGYPITSTSANHPGGAAAPGAERIAALFPEAVGEGTLMILDGGVLGNVPPSTLIDCTGSVPLLVREGAIPRGELRRRAGSMSP